MGASGALLPPSAPGVKLTVAPRLPGRRKPMKHRYKIRADELLDGDVLADSRRYGYKVHGLVKISARGNGIVFLSTPTLPDEDVAFQSQERVTVLREAEVQP